MWCRCVMSTTVRGGGLFADADASIRFRLVANRSLWASVSSPVTQKEKNKVSPRTEGSIELLFVCGEPKGRGLYGKCGYLCVVDEEEGGCVWLQNVDMDG